MSERKKRRGERGGASYNRPDFLEKDKPTEELIKLWPGIFAGLKEKFEATSDLDGLADLARTASIRAGTANERGLREWKSDWYGLKYDVLIKSARLKRHHGLDLEIEADYSSGQLKFLFIFGTRPKPFRTLSTPGNLGMKLEDAEYDELFGEIR